VGGSVEGGESKRRDVVHDLAAEMGICDLEKFLRTCLANAAVMSGFSAPARPAQNVKYSIEETAALLGVSTRWLADECRAERIEHVYLARHRFFTHTQILKLLKSYEVEPAGDRADRELARIMRRIGRDGTDRQRKYSRQVSVGELVPAGMKEW